MDNARQPRMNSPKVRIALQLVLLAVLLVFLGYRLQSEPVEVDWRDPVVMRIYPINADQTPATSAYLEQISSDDFTDIERFFREQALIYRLPLEQPIQVQLHPVISDLPPEVPDDPSILGALWWGLKMRLWVAFNDEFDVDDQTLRIFMSFYERGSEGGMQHSLGLQKGRIGLVNGFADLQFQGVNNFVAVHEALHTLGAKDHYDMETAQPVWPEGYADPVQYPLYPQTRAEVMGGRIKLSPGWAVLPPSLDYVRIGPATAISIGWTDAVVAAEMAKVEQ